MLHKVEEIGSENGSITLSSCRPFILARVLKGFMSYFKAYVNKHWWSFFQVLKVSPLPQKLEYAFYYLVPPIAVLLLVADVLWFLAFLITLIASIEVYSFVRGYYRALSLWERLAYPVVLVLVRVIRSYLALAGLLYNIIKRGIGVLG